MHAQQQAEMKQTARLPKLWEISTELIELEEAISNILEATDLTEEEQEQYATQTFNEWLAADYKFDEKASQVAAYIRHIEAISFARKEESKRLRELAKQAENRANSLRRYLIREMQRLGGTRIEGIRANASLRRKPQRLILLCTPEKIPEQFVRVTYEPCLSEIRRALKEDIDLPWAALSSEEEFSLQIK
jgi:capsid portal protein